MVNMRPFTAFEQKNLKFLVNHNVKFTQVEITSTGLGKGILDSTAPMRAFFLENNIHNYENQLQGQEYKQIKTACILTDSTQFFTKASFFLHLRRLLCFNFFLVFEKMFGRIFFSEAFKCGA